jgi:hypothetical protein
MSADDVARDGIKRRGFRCWVGSHRWKAQDRWPHRKPFVCTRCSRVNTPCSNCGDYHDPNAFTICTVTRRAS